FSNNLGRKRSMLSSQTVYVLKPLHIEYGVNLLGCFIEGYVGSNQALGKEAEAHFGKMTQAAVDLARGSFATCSEEHNWYEHFELLMRHPVINAGVQIAAWHHYRLPEDLLST